MERNKYQGIWLAFVEIKAKKGLVFNELIDQTSNSYQQQYIGAMANILVHAATINAALDIIPLGLGELGFEVIFINKIENFQSLVDYNELNESIKLEADWLLGSQYVFKISDKLFPYVGE